MFVYNTQASHLRAKEYCMLAILPLPLRLKTQLSILRSPPLFLRLARTSDAGGVLSRQIGRCRLHRGRPQEPCPGRRSPRFDCCLLGSQRNCGWTHHISEERLDKPGSPKITTELTAFIVSAGNSLAALCTSCPPWEYPLTTILELGHELNAFVTSEALFTLAHLARGTLLVDCGPLATYIS